MAMRSSSSSSKHDVFLSFRGTDTRHGFTAHLYKYLTDQGIHTFFRDEELPRGQEISPAILNGIEGSKIAIIVLSKHYASSSLCLDELVTIIHCMKIKRLWVIPVFYIVDPSDVQHQRGSYGDAFTTHEQMLKHNMDRLLKWKKALRQVANIPGYIIREGEKYEYMFIKSIVASVSKKIGTHLHVVDHPVGLKSRVTQVMELLDVGSDDVVHMVGIHGIRGIGKTTLAFAVYNFIANQFEDVCFLENMSENSYKQGLQHLQRILLTETVAGKNINITSVKQGISIIKHRLCRKKVLLLLDDVDKLEQLEAIAGKPDWFGPGSRIIITTRDQQLLSRHGVNRTYEVKGLNRNDALQLLNWKAFETENVDASYEDVLNEVVTYVSGHPLALEEMGSNLFGQSLTQWKYAVKQLKTNTDDHMLKKLEVSFDVLAEEEKSDDHILKKLEVSFDVLAEKEKSDDHMRNKLELSFDFLAEKEKSEDHMQNKLEVSFHDLPEEEKSHLELESCSDAFSYDVFLSFRGSDTLHGFTGYLHKALLESGIHTFIDDEGLQREEEIRPAIVKAIEESRIAIIVLSINYASSSFCLDELAFILDCLERKRLLVLPVFYNVDPSHLLHQTGSYGEALMKHEKDNMEKLQKWDMTMYQVANLPGFHFKHGDGYEYEFIGRIVEWVCSEINHSPLHVGYPVGLESKVLEVRKLLDVGCDDAIIIGICGTGGVGKSTLTREVYNSIAEHFDASYFIENVREKSKKHGLQYLQSIIFSKILGEKGTTLTSVQQRSSMIQCRLQRKKVLLILDDVDKPVQLQAVVERLDWFGPGSRVIITTQDKQLLASHEVKRTYEVKKLHEKDALQLLKWKAFKTQYFDSRYVELLNRVVTYASGLPLALEIIGSNLFGKNVEELINQFEKIPNALMQVIFKASFDTLEEKTRSIFLDMACCFKGCELAQIQDILHAHYGHSVKDEIDTLVDKSLVKLSHGTKPCYDTISLHDLIEDMGKEIEQQESLIEPSERRRLWLLEDIREVLEYNTGMSKIEMICLDFLISDKEEKVEWDGKIFQNMQNLKTIIIRNVNFSKGPEYLPNSLRVLEWWRYPSNCLPSDFHPKELAICKLPYSHILPTELSDLWKKFPTLKVFEFSSANV